MAGEHGRMKAVSLRLALLCSLAGALAGCPDVPPDPDGGSPVVDAGQPAPEDAGNVNDDAGNVDNDAGNVDDDAGNVNDDAGNVDSDAGNVDNDAGNVDNDAGNVDNDAGNVDVDAGNVDVDAGRPDGGVVDDAGNVDVDAGRPDGGVDPEPSQPPAVITTCDDGLVDGVSPGNDVCAVNAGSNATLIVGDVLTPGEVFEGGQVLVDDNGDITCVGCGCLAQAAGATQVICPDAVVSPGLINAHDHLGWMASAPYQDLAANSGLDDDERWEHRHDWRRGIRGHDEISAGPSGASTDAKALGAIRFALGGATGVFGSGSVSFLRDLDNSGTLPGVGLPGANYETFPLGDASGTLQDGNCNYGTIDQPGVGNGYSAYVPHVSEGIDAEARNEFLCLTGQLSGASDVLDDNSAIIHGVGLLPPDVDLMAQRGVGLVWTPRSNIALYGDTAQVTLMHARGVQIGLGTDWLPSGSMSMLRELKCIDDFNAENLQGYFTDESLWRMATVGSAATLGLDSRLGVLAVGHVGDVAVFRRNGHAPYRAVLEADPGDVALVLKGGEVLNGNSAVVSALTSGCDEIANVCGSAKRVCAQRETGSTLSALESSANLPYPLFECSTPRNEPTCLPARTLAGDRVDGSNNYEGVSRVDDTDGDGILDGDDNCPTVFNPIRPLDDGAQGDADDDGDGDVCDPCPLDANTTDCTTYNPNDADGDGIDNVDDNCPMDANGDQADGDNDDKGDVCDPCPGFTNPGTDGCPVSIVDIKTADILGDRVAIAGDLVVTAVAHNGFWAQLDQANPLPFSGLFLYEPDDNAHPSQGAVIQISGGTVADFFGQRQLSSVSWADQGTTQDLAAVVLDTGAQAQAVVDGGAYAYEGMLVQLDDAEVANAMPAAGPGDDATNEVALTTGVRVDDFLYPRVNGNPPVFLDPFPEDGFVFSSVTGILSLRNNFMKVGPRDDDDMVLGPPALRHFTPDTQSYARESAGAVPTFDGTVDALPLTIVLTSDAEGAPVVVELRSSNTNIFTVPASVSVAVGTREVVVPVSGIAAGTASLTANLQGDTDALSVDVRVLAANESGTVESLTPVNASVVVDTQETFTVALDIPAPPGGQVVSLNADAAIGSVDATVTVAENQRETSFLLTAASTAGTGTLSADGVMVSVDVVEEAMGTLDISGYRVGMRDDRFVIPDNTVLAAGDYIVVSRDVDKATFESNWGVTLGANVHFFRSGGTTIVVNNSSYTAVVEDASGAIVDGPTVGASNGQSISRLQPVGAADDGASWASPVSLSSATPGSGQDASASSVGLYLSEISDGQGGFANEFLELHFDGAVP